MMRGSIQYDTQDFLRMRELKEGIVTATAKAPTSNVVLIIGQFHIKNQRRGRDIADFFY